MVSNVQVFQYKSKTLLKHHGNLHVGLVKATAGVEPTHALADCKRVALRCQTYLVHSVHIEGYGGVTDPAA
jgi:hypothetical protein